MALSKYIAPCGFDCRECPAYKASHGGNEEDKKRLVERWSKAAGKAVTLEETLCDGCVAGGRLVAYCADCAIRTCAQAKGYPTCAHCPEMPECPKITQRKTREMLEKLKTELGI
jgi:hypothetical protein